jgi:hypothetical protein
VWIISIISANRLWRSVMSLKDGHRQAQGVCQRARRLLLDHMCTHRAPGAAATSGQAYCDSMSWLPFIRYSSGLVPCPPHCCLVARQLPRQRCCAKSALLLHHRYMHANCLGLHGACLMLPTAVPCCSAWFVAAH